jgi:ABC-2 type transport system ATP-binding protein
MWSEGPAIATCPACQSTIPVQVRIDLDTGAMQLIDSPLPTHSCAVVATITRFRELNQQRQVTIMITSHDMAELEQLAGRIIMIDHGNVAFDGSFLQLRRDVSDQRRLIIETADETPPPLRGATLLKSEAARHEYLFDATQVRIAELLEQASAATTIRDVETHRAPIDEVIADIYRSWRR